MVENGFKMLNTTWRGYVECVVPTFFDVTCVMPRTASPICARLLPAVCLDTFCFMILLVTGPMRIRDLHDTISKYL